MTHLKVQCGRGGARSQAKVLQGNRECNLHRAGSWNALCPLSLHFWGVSRDSHRQQQVSGGFPLCVRVYPNQGPHNSDAASHVLSKWGVQRVQRPYASPTREHDGDAGQDADGLRVSRRLQDGGLGCSMV